ncbi:MAG: dTDP-glucose pyrophosphorylase [Chloroflexi bacterium]|nr:dTDP-glucose pyrophosphorylase [Chloroflexota bacterium]
MPDGQKRKVVGLLPAAGTAARIAPLPCSKELYPVGFRHTSQNNGVRPKVAAHYLLERLRRAGIGKTFIILREGKWDIPAYFGDGRSFGIQLAYLMMGLPYGAPYTLDQAYPFVQDSLIALGFPDIIFQPGDAFAQLLDKQAATEADLVLGLFPADKPHKMDMVEMDENGRVRQIVIKPAQTHLRYTWFIAVWTPIFTQFMHEFLARQLEPGEQGKRGPGELYVGDVFQAAIDAQFHVETVLFPDGSYIDIGTPEDLTRAVNNIEQFS